LETKSVAAFFPLHREQERRRLIQAAAHGLGLVDQQLNALGELPARIGE
jgi:hypothetical protein